MSKILKLIALCFVSIVLISSCKKDEIISGPEYSVQLEGKFNHLCCNENNEIIIIGTNDDFDPPYGNCNDFIVVKTDQAGNVIWNKKYIIDFTVEPKMIINTSPDRYFIAIDNMIDHPQLGTVRSVLILQLNNEGEIVHQNALLLSGGVIFNDMIPDGTGGVFITGHAFYIENPGMVARISAAGELLFLHQFPYETKQVTQYPLGELCYMEYTHSSSYNWGVELHMTNTFGDEIYNGTVIRPCQYTFINFSEDQEHLIWYYIDNSDGHKYIIKTDFQNQVIWSSRVQIKDVDHDVYWDLRKMGSFYYVLGDYGQNDEIFYFIKFNESGDQELIFKNELFNEYSYYSEIQFIELNNGSIAFIQPAGIEEGCQSNNCVILQIFK